MAEPRPTDAVLLSARCALAALRAANPSPSDEDVVQAVLDAADHHRRPARAERVLAAAEDMLDRLSPYPSLVSKGLVARRRPGDAARALEAYREMLGAIHELRRVVEGSRPLYLTTGGS